MSAFATAKLPNSKDRAPAGSAHMFQLWPWLCVVPTVVFLLIFEYYPFIRAVILSFQNTDLFGRPVGFAGLGNYGMMLTDPEFWRILGWTFLFTVASVGTKLILGLLIAIPLSYRLRGTIFMRSTILIPMAISSAVGTLIFNQFFQPVVGAADQITTFLGIGTIDWNTSPLFARVGVVITDVWLGISFVVLLLMAAIDNINDDIFEAAEMDSCVGFNQVTRIILPIISPMLLFLTITKSLGALREFTVIHALTGGGPAGATTTLVFDVYKRAFGSSTNDYAGAAASAMVLLIFVLALTYLQYRLSRGRVKY